MNILITGASSPLGKYFLHESLKIFPSARILALSKSVIKIENPRVEFLHHDLAKDRFSRREAFDIVIHTASIVPKKAKKDSDFFCINCEGSLRLFQDIIFAKSASILNISSTSVYDDPHSKMLTEDSAKTTSDLYGLSKLQFESMLIEQFRSLSINILTCRIPVLLVKNVQNNFLSSWISDVSKNNKIKLFNPDDLFNACVSESDVFRFFLSFHKLFDNKNLICNLSCANPISIKQLAYFVMHCMGKKTGLDIKESSQVAQLVSNNLAIEHGFKPQSVHNSIKSFIE